MMFGDQAIRLLRDDWATAKMLAEELYAMMDAEEVSHEGVQNLAKVSQAEPYFNLTNFADGGSIFTVTGTKGDPLGSFNLSGGVLQFVATPPTTPQPNQRPRVTSGGGGGLAGQVVSGGPGEDYVVNTYPTGLSGPTVTVNAKQAGIDPGATIPPGTWGAVIQAGTGYILMVPLWA